MVWGALIGAGLSLLGGGMSARSSRKAAKTQADAANKAAEMQLEQYKQTREDLAPYTGAGKYGLEQLLGGYQNGSLSKPFELTDYQQDPGYQFRQQNGMNNIQSSAAAGGGLLSGATLKALNSYNSDLASQEFNNAYARYGNDQQNRYARLMDLAHMGQNSAVQTGALGQSAKGAAGLNLMHGGNASAAGIVGSNNAWTNTIGQLGSLASGYMQSRNSGVI